MPGGIKDGVNVAVLNSESLLFGVCVIVFSVAREIILCPLAERQKSDEGAHVCDYHLGCTSGNSPPCHVWDTSVRTRRSDLVPTAIRKLAGRLPSVPLSTRDYLKTDVQIHQGGHERGGCAEDYVDHPHCHVLLHGHSR